MTSRHLNPLRLGSAVGSRIGPGLIGALVLFAWGCATAAGPVAAPGQAPASTPTVKSAPAKPPVAGTAAKSGWSELTPAQQAALQPLAPTWGSISEAQRRKWIALSRNFQSLTPAERATLHGRMSEWINLSPVQRSQARLNFAQTNRLSTDEKKVQWEAYQALSLEQKQQLTAGGQHLPSGAAPAVKPVDPRKLAAVPVTRTEAASVAQPSNRSNTASRAPTNARRNAGPASAPVARP